MTTEQIHERGVRRHGADWANANQRAVDTLIGTGLKPWSPEVKDAIPRILLRVLDGVRLDAGQKWVNSDGKWV